MASLAELFDQVEAAIQRPLSEDEKTLVTRMYRAGKDAEYCVGVLSTPEPPEPADDELITTRYEATIAGPQDITGVWG